MRQTARAALARLGERGALHWFRQALLADDPNQVACPFAAHIRKVYPRDDLDNEESEKRRIIRAGIPFGKDTDADKGLLFVCYQTSIEQQFEKLQQDWANSVLNPTAGGHDLIIGQTDDQQRTFELITGGGASSQTLTTPAQWVTPTGGGYFFAPSITALRDVLTAGT